MNTRARILIVDDEPGIQRSASRILSRVYEVETASSGQDALKMLEKKYYNLAIVDVRMPGMNGFEVLKCIKKDHADTEVIIMTGSISNPEEKLVEAIRERAFYFINKPFEKTVLETLVRRCLELQRLESTERRHREELEEDLERARAFQQALLPRSFPRMAGLRGDFLYRPSERVGGDFFDFFPLQDHKLAVLIADVAGHGVSAALFTGMLKSEMRTIRDDWNHPEDLFEQVNERLVPLTNNQYITAALLILNLESRELEYVSAGHPSFFLSSGATCESTGTPLGMIEGWEYLAKTLPFPPGERVLLYTDGLTEARNDSGEEFESRRLRQVFLASRDLAPNQAVAQVFDTVQAFTGTSTLHDDATAILLEFNDHRSQ